MIYIILVAKLYKIMHKFDIKVVIKTIIEKIIRLAILWIIYINLRYFYNYLIKLGIIKKSNK